MFCILPPPAVRPDDIPDAAGSSTYKSVTLVPGTEKTSGFKLNEAVNGTDDEGRLRRRGRDQKLIYLAQCEVRLVKQN